ncbi:equilibrative nucleotide transporter 8 [Impatiens glandulifera]|uniref:equilibrative nucleotide transporter 8 n=1 Tax=Impatiens glandulifera TaxID=253017 RepID=UPI001FB11FE4|nr:equilibrative nucleotide transporter 8 [Impatiens glandulifera]
MEIAKEGNTSRDHQTEPRDTYKIAYTFHFLFGAGNLLPWNALITAVDYFNQLYPSSNHIERVFSVCYMTSSLLVLSILMNWTHNNNKKKPGSFRLRMNLGFSMLILTMILIPLLDWTSHCSRPNIAAYYVTIASVVVCGLADGLIGGSLIGSAGNLPKQYMQAIFAGTASSGILVSMLRIITKASLPQTPKGLQTSAHLYFIITTVILLICIVCCNLLYKLPVMQEHYKLLSDNDSLLSNSRPKFWEVARKIRWPAFGVMFIYAVTLSIFPGFISDNNLKSTSVKKDWYPVLLITVYNFSDLVGKCLPAVYVPKGVGKATWGCIMRVLFYPMFTVCLHGPKWMKTEVPIAILTMALGVSNGYLTSVIMMIVPKSVPTSEAEVGAVVMAVSLGIGLVAGSVLGWFWVI